MSGFDWFILIAYFFVMIGIGVWSYKRVGSADEYFTTGGKMPWWLAGVSHHMSGYSAAVFVAYAAVAYTNGFTLYVWWAVPVSIAVFIGAIWIAPRWARLREHYGVGSPMEYLATRYNVPTQQLMAWCGVVLKIFDVGPSGPPSPSSCRCSPACRCPSASSSPAACRSSTRPSAGCGRTP
ncbi:sodium:solute symporter family transporter [Alicyclobacillus macrosporangiidus]|uniref:sodium:solute symporter family transporter n=1 Tax=Alicyclobacillus macrosporangiidus TaxID=392015 RepID=UPI000A4D996B|nr:hypothetical protein [Alicyclobacillus macrosporangiidus]